jgi:IS66 C-terminal element
VTADISKAGRATHQNGGKNVSLPAEKKVTTAHAASHRGYELSAAGRGHRPDRAMAWARVNSNHPNLPSCRHGDQRKGFGASNKKQRLFFGDADAGERSAIIYSIIESCRPHGIEAYTYLHDVLTQLPSMTNRQIKDIVPKAWAARRNTALKAAQTSQMSQVVLTTFTAPWSQ